MATEKDNYRKTPEGLLSDVADEIQDRIGELKFLSPAIPEFLDSRSPNAEFISGIHTLLYSTAVKLEATYEKVALVKQELSDRQEEVKS